MRKKKMDIFEFVRNDEQFNYYYIEFNNNFIKALNVYATDHTNNKKDFLLNFTKSVYSVVLKTQYGKKIKYKEAVKQIAEYLGTTANSIYKLIAFYKKYKED